MLLLVNGCSHAAGAEIDYEWQDNCYDKAFGRWCADSLGYDYENLAISGASQDRIIRTTIEWVGKNYKRKDLFAVIMWSGPSRTEFYRKDDFVNIVPSNDHLYKKEFSNIEYLYYKSYVAVQDAFSQDIKFYNNVILLQNYLKYFNIPYVFLNATQAMNSHYSKLDYLDIQVDSTKYYKRHSFPDSYYHMLIKQGFKLPDHITRGGTHLGADAHKHYGLWLAEHIKETINGYI